MTLSLRFTTLWAFFAPHLQHKWTLTVFEFRQKTILSVFNLLLKIGTERLRLLSVDPELQEKLKYYSTQKRLQVLEQLWEQDFKREAAILALRRDDAVEKFLKGIASTQNPPEGENVLGWMDASGVWHPNPNWNIRR